MFEVMLLLSCEVINSKPREYWAGNYACVGRISDSQLVKKITIYRILSRRNHIRFVTKHDINSMVYIELCD